MDGCGERKIIINLIIGIVSASSFYKIFQENSEDFKDIWISTVKQQKLLHNIEEINQKELSLWYSWETQNGWFLHGKEIGPSIDSEIDIAYSYPYGLLETGKKCEYFSQRYSWSLIPWPNTFRCLCMAFITTDDNIYKNVKSIFKDLDIYISDYKTPGNFYNLFRTAIFNDYRIDGDFSWEVSLGEGHCPIIICDKSVSVPRIEKFIFSKLECLYEDLYISLGSYRTLNLSFYRVTDYRLYKKLWERSGKDLTTIRYAISGNSNIEEVKNAFLNTSSYVHSDNEFKELEYLASICGWVYRHSYGGGSDEYHAWFWANTPEILNKYRDHIELLNDWWGYF